MKPHRFDTLSFVSGLIFTGFGLLFLIPTNTEDLFDAFVDVGSWAWPLILLAIGLAILAPLFIGARARDDESDDVETAQVD